MKSAARKKSCTVPLPKFDRPANPCYTAFRCLLSAPIV